MRDKGKFYPSPSSSSSAAASPSPPPATSLSPAGDSLSSLKLLPAAILALATVLPLEDRQVLAYMITRSFKYTNPSSSSSSSPSSIKDKKKSFNTHKTPVFDCECFDFYTSYWFKWYSSPNRELIHQAIEAFEDHLKDGELSKKKSKKKDKTGHRRLVGKPETPPPEVPSPPEFKAQPLKQEDPDGVLNKAGEESQPPELASGMTGGATSAAATVSHHKGLARTVLPDVLGLLNSRLWRLFESECIGKA